MPESESGGDKTESATSKRREDARKEGQICVSRDFSQAVVLLCGLVVLSWMFPSMLAQCKTMLVTIFENCARVDISSDTMAAQTAWFVVTLAWIALPFIVVLFVISYFSMFFQVGFVMREMKFDLARMNPITAAKNLFMSPTAAVKLLMDLAKLGFISLIIVRAYHLFFPAAMGLVDADAQTIMIFLGQAAYWIALRVFVFLFVLSIADYAYQKWKYEEDLKMTKQEVKEEMKSQEGDPAIKQKIRSVQMQMARKRMFSAVPKADVVITNPIHFAVAVQYDMEAMAAPKVVAKGARLIAQKIKDIARENNVPIVENVPLAQALYKDVEVGGWVPEKLYKAVADVLAFVYKLNKGKMSQVSSQIAAKAN